MFNLKGLYEWKLIDAITGKVDQEGSQWNVISDRFLNFLFSGADNSYSYYSSAYNNCMAILLSDSTPTGGVDYRVAGASNGFNIIATGTLKTGNVDQTARSKYCDDNFSAPGSPRTIRVIGIKIYEGGSDTFPTSNFVSFIELSSPITQNTTQTLYVKYTVYVSYSMGVGYNTPNNRFIEYGMNNSLFADSLLRIGSGKHYPYGESSNYKDALCVTSFLPPSNINYVQRGVSTRYLSTNYNLQYNYGNPYGVSKAKTFATTDIPGPFGTLAFVIRNYVTQGTPTQYNYLYCTLGYSQTKDMSPSISRVFPHPAGREDQIFSDPSYPSSSAGAILISGTPTNKYPIIGKIRITKSGDASDLVDETVSYTAVDTGADTITVTQDIATGDKYRFTTTDTLPSPLSVGVDYYIINISSTSIKVASSYVLALAGTPLDLTTQGVGNHTMIRQNTGTYKLELSPWIETPPAPAGQGSTFAWMYRPWILYQLSMAIDYDGYLMPQDFNSETVTSTNYAEGDYVAINSSTYRNEFYPTTSASMLRGSVQNGNYIYSVQQSRKGLINNVCRWLFNTIETSQPLCKFGNGSTKVITVLDGGTVMYICTNDGVYRYTFATPTVAPVLLTITGMIGSSITDACIDPVTGYMWTGHATGLSRVNLGTLTATQYLNTTGQALDGLTSSEITIRGGQLDAYNGRVLKGGASYEDSNSSSYATAWVMDDGVGYYRVNGTVQCDSCCLRTGTNQVVYLYYTGGYYSAVYSVTVTGKNIGSSTATPGETRQFLSIQNTNMGAHVGQINSDTFIWVSSDYSNGVYVWTYKIGAAPVNYQLQTIGEPYSSAYSLTYSSGFGWALGAMRRSKVDFTGSQTYGFLWHHYLINQKLGVMSSYGWDGAAWVKDNANSRNIPKTATHSLVNGLSVDFNNGAGSWDVQFISGECSNFVYGPYRIKDNLQTVQIKARNYYCETHVIESYAATVPAVAPYEVTIPETSDPNFRDMDSTDFITEVYELTTPYTYYNPAEVSFTYVIGTDILTVGANIATGTAIAVRSVGSYLSIYDVVYPLKPSEIYYAINISPTTIKLATTYANALIGTAIDLTANGSGTHYYRIIAPTTGTYRMCSCGKFKFSAADAGKNLTLTYTYTKFTT